MLDIILIPMLQTALSILFIYKIVIVVSSLASWFVKDLNNPIVYFLYRITQPVYDYIKRYINTVFAGMDLAPIIVLFVIMFLEELIRNIIFH